MRSTAPVRRPALACSVAVLAVASLWFAPASATAAATAPPRVNTGPAQHVLGTSALLTGSIEPQGGETSYFFKWGTTTAYGQVTPTATIQPGATPRISVGAIVTKLVPGTVYHYRLVASNSKGSAEGHFDRTFMAKGTPLVFTVKNTAQTTYGAQFLLGGMLSGLGSGNHRIALEASPFPFLEPFSIIGLPGLTNAAGAFSFRVGNLLTTTQLRVITLDPLPVFSPTVTVTVVPRVVLHVRSSSQRGVVRLFGTITPAVNGAKILFQVQKAVRPGRNEVAVRWVNQFNTVAKKAGAESSRFSIVATILKGGRYRAYVKLPSHSRLGSGPSLATVILHAAPASAFVKHRK